jgi:hypothetical protein
MPDEKPVIKSHHLHPIRTKKKSLKVKHSGAFPQSQPSQPTSLQLATGTVVKPTPQKSKCLMWGGGILPEDPPPPANTPRVPVSKHFSMKPRAPQQIQLNWMTHQCFQPRKPPAQKILFPKAPKDKPPPPELLLLREMQPPSPIISKLPDYNQLSPIILNRPALHPLRSTPTVHN